MLQEVDFTSDTYEDILAKDNRYHPHAYAFLADIVKFLTGCGNHHCDADEIMEEFRAYALDQYGPLAYHVLTSWGLKSCEDIGEIMANLTEFKRVGKDDNDDMDDFLGGFDFHEAFVLPFEPEPEE